MWRSAQVLVKIPYLAGVSLLTSALGGLIVLGLFLKYWTVEKSVRVFDVIVRDVFGKDLAGGGGIFMQMRRHFRCWLNDGRYDVSSLEAFLKHNFGEERRIFDASEKGETSGVKVGVTASTISDASPYIFSNYNGWGQRTKDSGTCCNLVPSRS